MQHADHFPFRLALLLLAAVLAVSGCMVPIPSIPGEPPYKGTVERLSVGSTTRGEVIALLGEPPIQRGEGRLAIYAATRETAARLLAITIVPMTMPFEEFNFLFLEFDDAGVLNWRELVVLAQEPDPARPACDSHGHCLLFAEWGMAGLVPIWMSTGDVRDGERTVVTASLEDEARVRRMERAEGGCLVYLFARDRKTRWYEELAMKQPRNVSLSLDARPRYVSQHGSTLFAACPVDAGQHVVRAADQDGEIVAEFPVDCAPGELIPVVAEVVPTVAGMRPQVRFAVVSETEASQLMTGRRLVLE